MTDQLVDLTSRDASLIGQIIADGFHDDPVMTWALNGSKAIAPVNTALARHIYLKRGFGHRIAQARAGTLWLPPGAGKGGVGLFGTLEIMMACWRYGGMAALNRGQTVGEFMQAHKPKEPHYYLYAISVHPDYQGQGFGGRLISAGLAQADAARLPAYLENSKERNLPIYRSKGFEVVEKVEPAPGCPPLWLMWREPRSI